MTLRTIVSWLLLVGSLAFALGVVAPKMKAVRAITREKKAKVIVANNKKVRAESLQKLRQVFDAQDKRVETLISTLPNEPQLPEVLIMVEAMATQSNIALQSLLPQVDTRAKHVTITLVGEGDLGAIEQLMRSVGENNRPMSVEAFSLTKNQGNTTRLSFNLVVAVPYVVTPASEGAL